MAKFKVGQIVRHLKSGNLYRIAQGPDEGHRLEYCDQTFYVYKSVAHNGYEWYRRSDEVEDGRFVLVEE